MLITVHVTGLDDLVAAIKKLSEVSLYNVQLLQAPHPTAEQAIPEPTAKPKRAAPAPVAVEPAPVAAEPAPVAVEPAPVAAEPAPVPAPEAEPVAAQPAAINQFDEAKKLVLEISRVKGRDMASKVLEQFNAKRLTEVPTGDLPELIAKVNELLSLQ